MRDPECFEHGMRMIARAEAKFAAARERALRERAERAIRLNSAARKRRHEQYLVVAGQTGSKYPL